MNTEKKQNPLLGIFLVIMACLALSIMSGFVKAISHSDMSSQEILFFQSAAALIVLLPWILKEGRQVFVPKNKILVIGRALLGVSSMYLFFLAVKLVPLVNAVLLQNTIPLFIPILAFFLFRRKITIKVLATMIIGFIGVLLVLNPGRGFLRAGDLIALSAGFISAIVTIILGRLEDEGEHVPVVMLYYLIISMVVTGIWTIVAWKTPQGTLWLYLGLAGISYAAFQILLMVSLKYTTAVVIAPFIYLSVVFSGLVDWVVWKQTPDFMTVVGAAVVIMGAVLSTVHHSKSSQKIKIF